jgi:hypothetical protein
MKKEMRALALAALVCAMTAGMAMTAFGALLSNVILVR